MCDEILGTKLLLPFLLLIIFSVVRIQFNLFIVDFNSQVHSFDRRSQLFLQTWTFLFVTYHSFGSSEWSQLNCNIYFAPFSFNRVSFVYENLLSCKRTVLEARNCKYLLNFWVIRKRVILVETISYSYFQAKPIASVSYF